MPDTDPVRLYDLPPHFNAEALVDIGRHWLVLSDDGKVKRSDESAADGVRSCDSIRRKNPLAEKVQSSNQTLCGENMAVETRTVEYKHRDTVLEGVIAVDNASTQPRPVVMVSHAWGGRDDFAVQKARDLARLGYVGFALDLYGKGKLGSSKEENSALMAPLLEDRLLLQARMESAIEAAVSQPESDDKKVAAIGYCFGGLCVLDLARTGANVAGVVSFHGLFHPPGNTGRTGNRTHRSRGGLAGSCIRWCDARLYQSGSRRSGIWNGIS